MQDFAGDIEDLFSLRPRLYSLQRALSRRYVTRREAKFEGEERTVRVRSRVQPAALATIGYKTILSAFARSESRKLSVKLPGCVIPPSGFGSEIRLQGEYVGNYRNRHTCIGFLLQQEESSSNLCCNIFSLARSTHRIIARPKCQDQMTYPVLLLIIDDSSDTQTQYCTVGRCLVTTSAVRSSPRSIMGSMVLLVVPTAAEMEKSTIDRLPRSPGVVRIWARTRAMPTVIH